MPISTSTASFATAAGRSLPACNRAYAQSTGIKSLKVRHNNVLGYFVEVTAGNAGVLTKPPHAETFVHRQTLANFMRFSTLELAELEARITTAADRALALELDIFAQTYRGDSCRAERAIGGEHRASPSSTIMPALAELAVEQAYVRPEDR